MAIATQIVRHGSLSIELKGGQSMHSPHPISQLTTRVQTSSACSPCCGKPVAQIYAPQNPIRILEAFPDILAEQPLVQIGGRRAGGNGGENGS